MWAALNAFHLLISPYTLPLILGMHFLGKIRLLQGSVGLQTLFLVFNQPQGVKIPCNKHGQERFINMIYIKINLLLLWTVQIFPFLVQGTLQRYRLEKESSCEILA